MRRYGIPVVLALVVMLVYQLLISPRIADLLADWAFLHAARVQVLQQQQQPARPTEAPQ